MIRIELVARPGTGQRIVVRVTGDRGETLVYTEGPRDVALVALIEYLRGLTLRRIGE